MGSNKICQIYKHDNLTVSDFTTDYLDQKKPAIISGSINWLAIKKWTPSFLKESYPTKEVALTVFSPEINMPGTELKLKMPEAVNLVCNNTDESKRYYLMQRSLHNEFPELLSDIDMPRYADKSKEHIINFWFGQQGVNTKPHYDYSNNFLVQVVGRKRVRLFAPNDTSHMYPYSIHDRVTMDRVDHPAVQASQIADIDFMVDSHFPNFKLTTCFEGFLDPGDLLYIPAGWWHEVKSLDVSMSVNFWWKIQIENFPSEQLSKVVSSYFHWYGDSFHEKIRLAFDFTEFADDLQIAEFSLIKNLKCVSAFFILSYLNKMNGNLNNKISEWKQYLESAKSNDETLLQNAKILNIINEIKSYESSLVQINS